MDMFHWIWWEEFESVQVQSELPSIWRVTHIGLSVIAYIKVKVALSQQCKIWA